MGDETILLDTAKRRRYALNVLIFTIIFLHVIAFILVIALIKADMDITDTKSLAAMFSTSMFGIGATILLLISNKAVDAFLSKIGPIQSSVITETTTKKTEVVPAPAKDININGENVNVSESNS